MKINIIGALRVFGKGRFSSPSIFVCWLSWEIRLYFIKGNNGVLKFASIIRLMVKEMGTSIQVLIGDFSIRFSTLVSV